MAILDNLVAYWPLDEESTGAGAVTRSDVHSTNHLTDNNTTASGTGKVIRGADFESGNSEYLSIADNVALSITGAITISCWVKFESLGANRDLVAKFAGGTNNSFILFFRSSDSRFVWIVYHDGSTAKTLVLNSFGAPTTGVWYFVTVAYDGSNLRGSVNNGTVDTIAHTTGIFNSTAGFTLGKRDTTGGQHDGLLDEVGVWSRSLTSGEITTLYNSGNGVAYPFDDADAYGNIAITAQSPVIYCRDADDATAVPVAGTYEGAPTAIEGWFDLGGAADYQTIDAAPAGGVWSGTRPGTPGGQGLMRVRFVNAPAISGSATFRIGDVFGVAGQSNAEGQFTNNQTYTHATINSYVFDENDVALRALVDPTDQDALGSVWPIVGTYIATGKSIPVAFITTAESGSGLHNGEWLKGGTKYNAMLARITASGINAVRAVLFFQGENDAASGVSEALYEADVIQMSADMHADIAGAPVVLVGQIDMAIATAAATDAIRKAQSDSWVDANIRRGPVTYDLGPLADSLHFKTDPEAAALAARWWLCIDDALYSGANGRGPRVSSITHNAGKTEITVNFDRTLDSDTTYGAAAWIVKDNGTPATISGVVRSSNSAVITLSSAASGTLTVTFGSFDDAQGLIVPKSTAISLPGGGTAKLPAEPFVDQTSIASPTGPTGFASRILTKAVQRAAFY